MAARTRAPQASQGWTPRGAQAMMHRHGIDPEDSSQHGEPVAPRWTSEDTLHAMLIMLLVALVMCVGCVDGDPAAPGSAAHDHNVCTLVDVNVVITDSDVAAADSARYLCRP